LAGALMVVVGMVVLVVLELLLAVVPPAVMGVTQW